MKIVLSTLVAIGLILFVVLYRSKSAYEARWKGYDAHVYVEKQLGRDQSMLVTLRAHDSSDREIFWATFEGDQCTALRLGYPSTLVTDPATSHDIAVRYALRLVTDARTEVARREHRIRRPLSSAFPKWVNKLRYLIASRSASAGGFFVHTAESSNGYDKGILYA